jgi:hypothetical protein
VEKNVFFIFSKNKKYSKRLTFLLIFELVCIVGFNGAAEFIYKYLTLIKQLGKFVTKLIQPTLTTAAHTGETTGGPFKEIDG